jgi:hypothetical protein
VQIKLLCSFVKINPHGSLLKYDILIIKYMRKKSMGKDNRNCILQKLAKIWQEAEPVAKKPGEVGGITLNRKK